MWIAANGSASTSTRSAPRTRRSRSANRQRSRWMAGLRHRALRRRRRRDRRQADPHVRSRSSTGSLDRRRWPRGSAVTRATTKSASTSSRRACRPRLATLASSTSTLPTGRRMGHQAADGAYFTRPEAARLLAEMALDQTSVDCFSDRGSGASSKPRTLRVAAARYWMPGSKAERTASEPKVATKSGAPCGTRRQSNSSPRGSTSTRCRCRWPPAVSSSGICPWTTGKFRFTSSSTGEQATAKSDWERSNCSATMKSWEQPRHVRLGRRRHR